MKLLRGILWLLVRIAKSVERRWPRSSQTRGEARALLLLVAVFTSFLFPAIGYARREYRDGVRRQLIREVKTELEHWYNERGGFPLHPSGDLGWCGFSDDPEDWFFTDILMRERNRPELQGGPRNATAPLRYCPTDAPAAADTKPPLARGFTLEVALENQGPERRGFNTEYNMFERTRTVDGRSQFVLCGGSETQCGTEKPE